MRVRTFSRMVAVAVLSLVLIIALGCGGGGSSSGTTQVSAPVRLTIVTPATLPATVLHQQYSTMLVTQNAQGPLHWSIAPVAPTVSFVEGLSVDSSTGVLSGTVNFEGDAAFIGTVTDGVNSASRTFGILSFGPLATRGDKTVQVSEFAPQSGVITDVSGGFPPLKFRILKGALPPGMRLDPNSGSMISGPFTSGTFVATIEVTDSFTPAEVATQQITFNVTLPPLSIANSLPATLPINVPFSGKVVAQGGTPPYHFLPAGALPPGLTLDSSTGQLTGTPTASGSTLFDVLVTDTSTPPQSARASFDVSVGPPHGRNDTIANATPVPIFNGTGVMTASISPYIDPPNGPPTAGDTDYYKISAVAGSTVHIQVSAVTIPASPIDTVLEILDANGARFSTCREPGDTSTTFASVCVNDDISASPHITDSALDFNVPGTAGTGVTFYAHVLDFRGTARPDLVYIFFVGGAVAPLTIENASTHPAALGAGYNESLLANNAVGTTTWSIAGGSLPPGLTLSSGGTITGSATTLGTFPFTVKVTDASTPPHIATGQFTIEVVPPLVVTSSAVFPDACVGQPYQFQVQATSSALPIEYGLSGGTAWPMLFDFNTGLSHGTPTTVGTFTNVLNVSDATLFFVTQHISVTVKNCP
jgi:large repetitive protein